jgi:hypothetical protein
MSNFSYDSVQQNEKEKGRGQRQQDTDPPPLTIQICPLCQGSGTIICERGKVEENIPTSGSSNNKSTSSHPPPPLSPLPPLAPNSHTLKNDNATSTTASTATTTTATATATADDSSCFFPNPMQTEEKCNCCDGKGWVTEPQVANSRFCKIE